MEMKGRREALSSKQKDKAMQSSEHRETTRLRSRITSDQQSSSIMGIRSVLRRLVTWLKQTALFSWLHHAAVELKQSVMRNQHWLNKLILIGLWVLLLWLLSNLHMGLPCFLLSLVFWLYTTYGGPSPSALFNEWQEVQGD